MKVIPLSPIRLRVLGITAISSALSSSVIITTIFGGFSTEFNVIVTDLEAVPPLPVQARVYVEVVVGKTDCVPDVVFDPDQAPEAVQDVTLVEDQVSVDEPLNAIEVGEAERDRVGGCDIFSKLILLRASN